MASPLKFEERLMDICRAEFAQLLAVHAYQLEHAEEIRLKEELELEEAAQYEIHVEIRRSMGAWA